MSGKKTRNQLSFEMRKVTFQKKTNSMEIQCFIQEFISQYQSMSMNGRIIVVIRRRKVMEILIEWEFDNFRYPESRLNHKGHHD